MFPPVTRPSGHHVSVAPSCLRVAPPPFTARLLVGDVHIGSTCDFLLYFFFFAEIDSDFITISSTAVVAGVELGAGRLHLKFTNESELELQGSRVSAVAFRRAIQANKEATTRMPKRRSGELGGGRTANRRRRHLYLVFDDWLWGYSIRKVDLSSDSYSDEPPHQHDAAISGDGAERRLPPSRLPRGGPAWVSQRLRCRLRHQDHRHDSHQRGRDGHSSPGAELRRPRLRRPHAAVRLRPSGPR